MDPTYTPIFNSTIPRAPNHNRLKFTIPSARLTTQSHLANLVGKLIRSVSLLVPTGSRQAIKVFCQLLEHMLRNNKSNQHEYLMDIFDLLSILNSVFPKSQRLWLQIRALFLTILQNKSIPHLTSQELTLRKAQFSPAEQFNKSIENEQISSQMRAALISIYRMKPYTENTSQMSGLLYIFLTQHNLIEFQFQQVISQQWLVNKLHLQKTLLASAQSVEQHYTQIVNYLDSSQYSTPLNNLDNLKTVDMRAYIDHICRQLEYEDSLDLWIELCNLAPTVQQMVQLTKIYEQFHLDMYLNNNLGPQCDLSVVIHELTRRESLILKYTTCHKLTSIINQLKEKPMELSTWNTNEIFSQNI